MPRGSSQKREQEYKKIEQKFEKEGRYKGREEEVAARIVNKQRAQAGQTKKRPSTKKKDLKREAEQSSDPAGSRRSPATAKELPRRRVLASVREPILN
jgi:hypothetical protein